MSKLPETGPSLRRYLQAQKRQAGRAADASPFTRSGMSVTAENRVEVTIDGAFIVRGPLTVTQTADITGATTIDGTLDIGAATTIGGTLTVTGHTWIAGVDVTVMLTSQDASLAGLNLRLNAAEAAIAAMQSTLASHGSTLASHGSRLDGAEGDIASLAASRVSILGMIDSLINRVYALEHP